MVAAHRGQFSEKGPRDVPTQGPWRGSLKATAASSPPHLPKGAEDTMNLQMPSWGQTRLCLLWGGGAGNM